MTRLDYANPTLRREIGLFGAVMLGLGSILGTGVFVSLAHATELAGPWVLLAIVLAGLLAYCNAMSSAQLAAAYPVSGGTYEYGYRVLNPALGFTAGWMFLLAKSASAATAALAVALLFNEPIKRGVCSLEHFFVGTPVTFGQPQLMTPSEQHVTGILNWIQNIAETGMPLAVVIILAFALLILAGMKRNARANAFLVTITLIGLTGFSLYLSPRITAGDFVTSSVFGLPNVLEATAFTFVAFTGYGRLATLGEEVRDPSRTIPRAILITLACALYVYLSVGVVLVAAREWSMAHSVGSLVEVAAFAHSLLLTTVLKCSAVTAMLGVLLNLILGLSRVWLAMGRRGDMPRVLARVNEKTSTPVPATILSGIVIALLVLVGDVRTTWSFSAFTVLIYYAITNLACLRLAPEHRRYPRFLAWIGLFACLSLAWFVEMKVWIAGTILIGVGLVWFRIRQRWRVNVA